MRNTYYTTVKISVPGSLNNKAVRGMLQRIIQEGINNYETYAGIWNTKASRREADYVLKSDIEVGPVSRDFTV